MAYHLYIVEIMHKINQHDMPASLKPNTSEISIKLTVV